MQRLWDSIRNRSAAEDRRTLLRRATYQQSSPRSHGWASAPCFTVRSVTFSYRRSCGTCTTASTRKFAETSDGSAIFRGAGIEADARIRWKRTNKGKLRAPQARISTSRRRSAVTAAMKPVWSNIGPSWSSYPPKRAVPPSAAASATGGSFACHIVPFPGAVFALSVDRPLRPTNISHHSSRLQERFTRTAGTRRTHDPRCTRRSRHRRRNSLRRTPHP